MQTLKQFFSGMFLLAVVLCSLLASGCSTMGYGDAKIDTTKKAILAAASEARETNGLIQDLLQRDVITPDVAEDATDEVERIQVQLSNALDLVDLFGDPVSAESKLQAANASLSILISLLSTYTGDSPQ